MDAAYAAFAGTVDPATPAVHYEFDCLGRTKTITQENQSQLIYTPAADLGVDTETIHYDLNKDGDYGNAGDFTRVLDRADRSLGRDTGWTLGAEHQATYGYDTATGQPTTVGNPTMGTFNYGYTYTQAAAVGSPRVGATEGTLKQDFIPYTLTKNGDILKTIRTYEATRDVLVSIQNFADTTVRSKYDYSNVNGGVNSLGQRMGVQTTFNLTDTPTTQATSWGYDSLGQLTAADLPGADADSPDRTYAYDTIGNRTQAAKGAFTIPQGQTVPVFTPATGGTTAYTPNLLNQYDAIGAVAPEHDFDGNMTHGPLPVSPSANCTLVWDAENRLIEVKNASNVSLVRYAYDALSRRISRSVGVTPTTTLYLYESWNCIAEYTIQNSEFKIQNSYLWGLDLSGTLQGVGGVGGLLAMRIHTGGIGVEGCYHPTYDGNGNISEYLKPNGDVAAHFEYDPFGNTTVASLLETGNLTVETFSYRFSTKPLDSVTGLYYYAYRYYDPLTGRWPSRDPIGERGGVNLYGFAGNNLIQRIDVLGQSPGGTISVERCQIYVYYGHLGKGADSLKWKFNGRCALGGAIGCYPISNNPPAEEPIWRNGNVPENHRVPGLPYDHDEQMALMNSNDLDMARDSRDLSNGRVPNPEPGMEHGMPIALNNFFDHLKEARAKLCDRDGCCCPEVEVIVHVDDYGDNDELQRGIDNFTHRGGDLKVGKDYKYTYPCPSSRK